LQQDLDRFIAASPGRTIRAVLKASFTIIRPSRLAMRLSVRRSRTQDGRYKVFVQASWSSGAIEQHGDAGGTRTHLDNNASPVRQLWAPSNSKLTHLKTGADNNSVGFLVSHYGYSISRKKLSSIKQRVKSQGAGYIKSIMRATSGILGSANTRKPCIAVQH
jgi:hypothetical protein